MSRLNLPNGDWADFDTRLNYAQARRIRQASDTIDGQATFVATLVRNWAIRDTHDEPIEFPQREDDGIPLEALNRVPLDTFADMASHAANELEGIPDPKGTSGTSTASSRARQPSASRRTSQTPSSSRTTRAGMNGISGQPQPSS